MKHLVHTLAFVAALASGGASVVAFALPVWAQSPMTPSQPNSPSSNQPAAAQPAPAAAPDATRPVRHTGRRYGGSASDRVANQLNAAELGRVGTRVGTYPARAAYPYAPPYAAPAYPPPPPWGYPPPYPYPAPGFYRPY